MTIPTDSNNFDYNMILPAVAGTAVAVGAATYCLAKRIWNGQTSPDTSSLQNKISLQDQLAQAQETQIQSEQTLKQLQQQLTDSLESMDGSQLIDRAKEAIDNGEDQVFLAIFKKGLDLLNNEHNGKPLLACAMEKFWSESFVHTTIAHGLRFIEQELTLLEFAIKEWGLGCEPHIQKENARDFYFTPLEGPDNKSFYDLICEGSEQKPKSHLLWRAMHNIEKHLQPGNDESADGKRTSPEVANAILEGALFNLHGTKETSFYINSENPICPPNCEMGGRDPFRYQFKKALEMGATNVHETSSDRPIKCDSTALEYACAFLNLAESRIIIKWKEDNWRECEEFYYGPIAAQGNKTLYDLILEGLEKKPESGILRTAGEAILKNCPWSKTVDAESAHGELPASDC